MIQKAQAILAGLASIFGKYHGKFWRDTPPEPQGANCAVVPKKKRSGLPLFLTETRRGALIAPPADAFRTA